MTDLDLKAILERAEATTEGPWFYNSYSGVFSGPLTRAYDAWFATIPEGHTVERRGECPPCGRWKQIACIAPETYEHGCRYFSGDYERDPLVASVPSHHGDTAIGKRAADADFIAHARTDVPALVAEIERLREELLIAERHIERGNDETMRAWSEVRSRDRRIEVLESQRDQVLNLCDEFWINLTEEAVAGRYVRADDVRAAYQSQETT